MFRPTAAALLAVAASAALPAAAGAAPSLRSSVPQAIAPVIAQLPPWHRPGAARRRAAARQAIGHAHRSAVGRRALAAAALPCADGSGALCGSITVPLDWSSRVGRTISIAYKLYLHTGPGRAVSTIVPNYGGPGGSTFFDGDAGFVDYAYGSLRDRFDVLLVDDRGRGQSTALDCPDLQHAVGSLNSRLASCAAQLGPDIDKYGTASIARDVEAVRRTVGAGTIDYYGGSYGAIDALAYAARFGSHLRSIVLNSGWSAPSYTDALRLQNGALRRIITGLCSPTTTCGHTIADPVGAVADAAELLRRHPVVGDALDQSGNPMHVVIDDARLADTIYNGDANPLLNPGQIPAAAIALEHGDTAPLLRIVAETPELQGATGDYGSPTDYSAGAQLATDCLDYRRQLPWRSGLNRDQRLASALRQARTIAPADLLPFDAATVFGVGAIDTTFCSYWPDVVGEVPVPNPATLPDVPILSLSGSFDENVPTAVSHQVARLFRRHQEIEIARSAHGAGFEQCGPQQAQAFIATLGRVDATCNAPAPTLFAQASFPRTSGEVVPLAVSTGGGDASTAGDRRLAAAVAATVQDAVHEWFREAGLFTATGLRGGTVTNSITDAGFPIDLLADRYVEDVAVTGQLTFGFDVNAASGTFTFVGPGGSSGTLTIAGQLGQHDRDGSPLTVVGAIDGRPVSLLAPTT